MIGQADAQRASQVGQGGGWRAPGFPVPDSVVEGVRVGLVADQRLPAVGAPQRHHLPVLAPSQMRAVVHDAVAGQHSRCAPARAIPHAVGDFHALGEGDVQGGGDGLYRIGSLPDGDRLTVAVEGYLRREVLVVVVGDAGRRSPTCAVPVSEGDLFPLSDGLGRVVVHPEEKLLAVVLHGQGRVGQREDVVDDLGFLGGLGQGQFSPQTERGAVGGERRVAVGDVVPRHQLPVCFSQGRQVLGQLGRQVA